MLRDLRRREDGAALVEAALVLPVLLLLVLGLTEISLYFWNAGLANKAVQLGARRAVVSSSVAVGPGLDPAESTEFWHGLAPGARCFPTAGSASPCPDFSVECDLAAGCRCLRGQCGFRLATGRLGPILAAMRAVLPEIGAENVRVTYTTNGLGHVTRPGPAPVDVRVTLVGLHYRPIFLADALGSALPLGATVQLPSESLVTRRAIPPSR